MAWTTFDTLLFCLFYRWQCVFKGKKNALTKYGSYSRAANNSLSSDIGRPKFVCVQRNPNCGRTWCPDKFFIVNRFTIRMNKNLPWVNLTFLVMSDHNLFCPTKMVSVGHVPSREKKYICSPAIPNYPPKFHQGKKSFVQRHQNFLYICFYTDYFAYEPCSIFRSEAHWPAWSDWRNKCLVDGRLKAAYMFHRSVRGLEVLV